MKVITIVAASITVLVFASVMTVRFVSGQSDSPCVTGGAVGSDNAGLAADCETLLGIKSALQGSADLNWWSGRSIDDWDGVTTRGGRVAELSLPNRNMDGVIPAGLGNLSALKTLDLSSNSLTGQIPASLNNLRLSRLRLGGNSLTGCVPPNLLKVSDSDVASLNLSACRSATPTPALTATATPTPGPIDDLYDLLAFAHCTANDFTSVFATSTPYAIAPRGSKAVSWKPNGRGWVASIQTDWTGTGANGTSQFLCRTVLHTNESSAMLDSGEHQELERMAALGTFDVLEARKIRSTYDIGEDFIASHVGLGTNRVDKADTWRYGSTAALFRQGSINVSIVELWPAATDGSPSFPHVSRVAELGRRIDDRLRALAARNIDPYGLLVEGLQEAKDVSQRELREFSGIALTSTRIPATPVPTLPPGAPVVEISIRNFQHADAEVKAGTVVIWTNNSKALHTVTHINTGGARLFDSGTISPGVGFRYQFTKPGAYEYQCLIHPVNMKGTITVTE